MFLGINEVSGVDLRSAGIGFFHSFRANPGGPMLITQGGDAVVIVYLEGKTAFGFAPRTQLAFQTNGYFIATPRIEIDPTSVFNPLSAATQAFGDLIVENSGVYLAAKQIGSMWDDEITRIPLWETRTEPSEQPLGFRAWRLVIGEGPDAKVIWERGVDAS